MFIAAICVLLSMLIEGAGGSRGERRLQVWKLWISSIKWEALATSFNYIVLKEAV